MSAPGGARWPHLAFPIVAAALQLAGYLLIGLGGLLPAATFWSFVPVLAGLCLWSWLALAVGEAAVGITIGRRKVPVAALTTTALLCSQAVARSSGHGPGPLVLSSAACVAAHFVALWLIGSRSGREAARRSALEPRRAAGHGWSSVAAWTSAVLAAGLVLWLAIVEVLRPEPWAEGRVIGDLRAMISAQAAYAELNSGFYDTPECLQAPARCLPGQRASAPAFLAPGTWSGTVGRYRRRFVPGDGIPPSQLPDHASRSSLESFAYLATPVQPGGLRGMLSRVAGFTLEGARGFCADSTGLLCVTDDGREPALAGGVCAPGCKALP